MSFVTVNHLLKRFDQQTVFENINFSINKGEFITLLGPSGCGKSTLLRSIAGLHPLDAGEVWVNNKNITQLKPQQRDIGMVFQSYALFPNMTVQDNIAFGLKMKNMPASKIKQQVADIIALVELVGKEQSYPQQLSGGQRQRVALARALVMKPQLLLLDEPLSALDAPIRKSLRQQIKAIQKELNLTTLFVTHDQEEAMTLSDRIFLMNKGKIVQQGSAEHIYTQPADEFVASFMGNYNLLNAQQASQLLGLSIEGKLAIRPESIYMREQGRDYAPHISKPTDAVIKSHQLLGNVIRYQVQAKGCDFAVDLLNRSSERLLQPGSSLELLFNLNELKQVS